MERIKKAVEQARLARSASPLRPAVVGKSKSVDVSEIVYIETKTFKVPRHKYSAKRVTAGRKDDEITAAYKMLRTHVLQRMEKNQWNTLAITSPSAGDGKTLTSVNLAISLAKEINYTVLLVDLDLRRSGVHRYFDYKPEKGLVDYLLSDTPLSSVLVNPGIDRLVILPSSRTVENSSELLCSPKMVNLVAELKSRYRSRLVLFDLPPLLAADDALAFLPHVDSVLLVVQDGKTTREEVKRSTELLQGAPLLGTVLNKCEERLVPYY